MNDIERILFTREQISEDIKKLGKKITEDYKGKDLLVVGVITGAFIFIADLIRELDLPLQVDFVGASSYGTGTVSGELVFTKKHSLDPAGKDVLLVEDIIDTGRTLEKLKEHFIKHGAKSVKICAMLDKSEARLVDIQPDYCCEQVGNEFIVGYGLDYNYSYRNLPYIGVLKKEIYM